MRETLTALESTFTHYDAAGARSEHPRPRCDCGGIFDPHESKDAAVCRGCGKEVDGEKHARSMQEIVASAKSISTPAGLGAQTFERALATTIEPPPRETSGLRCVRAESFRQDNDGDVMVKPFGMACEVAIDDPLALLAVTMAAIKFGHGPEMLAAALKLVADFGKEPHK